MDPHDIVTDVWREVLEQRDVREDTTFFASGGTSLAAAHLTLRVGRALGCRVPLTAVTKTDPTLREFRAHVLALAGAVTSDPTS